MGKIRIDPAVYFLWAALLLMLPLKWLLSAAVAAIIHEFGHIVAIRLTGGTVSAISIHPGGAEIETTPMDPPRELICALAGPVSGFLLLFFVRWIPLIALCAAVQSAFNLLPIFPSDGGRAFRCILALLLPRPFGCKVYLWVELVFTVVLFMAGIAACFCLHLGILPIMILSTISAKVLVRKIPCKTWSLRVQ